MDTDEQVWQLLRANSAWECSDAELRAPGWVPRLPKSRQWAHEVLDEAAERIQGPPNPLPEHCDSVVLVTKGPHSGSTRSLVDIVARLLAFGTHLVCVTHLPSNEAIEIAHALYPDVWMNFARPPVGSAVWSQIGEIFDRPTFTDIFGVPFDPSMVREGSRVCAENGLSTSDFGAIWQTGRRPLQREVAVSNYGEHAAEFVLGTSDSIDWYRCSHPIGIQKLASSLMAFALRHPALYGGEPTIVLNGQFALLSDLFSHPEKGAVIAEIALPENRTVTDFRRLLSGSSDVPSACRIGSIRRDAYDGNFAVDRPDQPITPWANVVHASDGYLSGAIETRRLVPTCKSTRLERDLATAGYTPFEVEQLILADPIVARRDDESRLTRVTKGVGRLDCIRLIADAFPSQRAMHGTRSDDAALRALLRLACSQQPSTLLERSVPIPGAREPRQVMHRRDLEPGLELAGLAALRRGSLGVAIPLAGSGGRFGGYSEAEGSSARLKPLIPLFEVGGQTVSALDVRAAHIRTLQHEYNASIPLFLSCSHNTRERVQTWAANQDLSCAAGSVPEFYRIRAHDGDVGYLTAWEAISSVLRDAQGRPELKPQGSLGLFWALLASGVLDSWLDDGVRYVAAANADDVGFRVDPSVVGLLETDPTLDAVALVTATSEGQDQRGPRTPQRKGGLLRERPVSGGYSRYVEENAIREHPENDLFNTNQLYIRLKSLAKALTGVLSGTLADQISFYFEAKPVKLSDGIVEAWHAYQPNCDVLRLMDHVAAVQIQGRPSIGQRGGYSPLKTPADVSVSQNTLDILAELGDVLTLRDAEAH